MLELRKESSEKFRKENVALNMALTKRLPERVPVVVSGQYMASTHRL